MTVEIQIVAIETNVRTLLKDHPNPQQFIKTLQNEAIDQAFREISEGMDNGFLEVACQLSELRKRIENLEKKRD